MPFPYEVDFSVVESDLDTYVDAVFGALKSGFLVMPKGDGFVEFDVFDAAYEVLKKATGGFREVTPDRVVPVVMKRPICLIVLRCMLGFTPPEWAYHASVYSKVEVSQGAARSIDRAIRLVPEAPVSTRATVKRKRIAALVESACQLLVAGTGDGVEEDMIHRLDKADTKEGLVSLSAAAQLGMPYSILLYERLLGRPFASHRDSVSELIGDVVENAVEDELAKHGVSARKTKRAERLPGFDQTPDFVAPNEHNPKVVIEAKLTEDDGTARDKVTRIQHLAQLSTSGGTGPGFEVVGCIAGRGFAVRREDMRKLILATRGKVFTLRNMSDLVEHTGLKEFRSS
ncbi:MAG: hypothetical protein OXT64_00680 [Gammaproteobacteria bacterium]|nr:hypothetical protein [Gammaproteobacteria bacterium]